VLFLVELVTTGDLVDVSLYHRYIAGIGS
jgi:hypothetical protein